MFDSSYPPLLVQPITMQHFTLFPTHEGYFVHPLDGEQALVGYKDGWTFPLSLLQQKFISKAPLLLVRNEGRITTSGSTFDKGYAHQFCREDGQAPISLLQQAIFPEEASADWMLVADSVVMIWLQYGYKVQYCGDSGFDMERHYYGKLLIRNFVIQEDFAPKLDKKADIVGSAKQYRVASREIYNSSWNVKDRDPAKHLDEILIANDLTQYRPALMVAYKRATTPP